MPAAVKNDPFSKPSNWTLLPGLLLACSITLTIIAWYISRNHLRERTEERFAYAVGNIQSAIRVRMSAYEQVLRNAVGFFNATDTVTQQEWKKYVQTLHLQKDYPGIQGLGYTIRLAPGEVAPFTSRMRADGLPNFRVWPEDARSEYHSIIYLEPDNEKNRRALGYDMFTEDNRREAMQRAGTTGEPALSRMVTLVQDKDNIEQKGCLLYLPVYARGAGQEANRNQWAALKGFVYSPFRINDLMQGILGGTDPGVEFEIYDGAGTDTAQLFYRSHRYHSKGSAAKLSQTRLIEVSGHRWSLVFAARPGFVSRYELALPGMIGAAGILVNLLLLYILLRMNALSVRNRVLADRYKEAEEAQRRFSEELEVTVQARTLELQRSNEDLERFAHVASHDLKEPVRKMLTTIDLIRMKYGGSIGEGAGLLDRVSRSATRLSEMIDSILAYSTAKYEPQPAALVDLNSIISHVREDLELVISEKGATLEVQPLPAIEGSAVLLHQLFYNLLNNSLKFSRAGVAPVVAVSCREAADEVELLLTDNGIGFEGEEGERIFQSFFRLHSKDRFEGTGLGLALCKRIVERHGGTIRAEGLPGKGASFMMRFPRRQPGGMI